MTIILIGISIILFFTIVSGLYVFLIGFVRKSNVSWLIESEIRQTPFGKHYPQILAADQWLQRHEAQGVSIVSSDGLRLHGLWVPAENSIGTVLLVHGYRSTYLLDFGPAFARYHEMGFNLLIPEQRAHGESQGKLITFGIKESDDMLQWCNYHNEHLSDCEIVLSGLSMGASTVIYMLGRDLPSNVRGIIADCGFTSPKAILQSVFCKTTHLPAEPSLLVVDLLTRLFAGFSISQFDSQKILQQASIPILLIHGMQDGFVPREMSQLAFNACISDKDILLVDGADHGESFLVEPERYVFKVKYFLEKKLGFKLRKD